MKQIFSSNKKEIFKHIIDEFFFSHEKDVEKMVSMKRGREEFGSSSESTRGLITSHTGIESLWEMDGSRTGKIEPKRKVAQVENLYL